MPRSFRRRTAAITLLAFLVSGCGPSRPFYFFEDGDLSHYKGVATEIEYPDVQHASLDEVSQALPPLTVANNEPQSFWDLTLEEAIRNALANSKVMRQLGGQLTSNIGSLGSNSTPATQLVSSGLTGVPSVQIPTVYLPALVESDPRFGTEAALAAFDAQLQSTLFWQKNDRPINLDPANIASAFQRLIYQQDLMQFNNQLQKTTAGGTVFSLRHNTAYEWNNNQSNRFPSVWTPVIEMEARHPLLQGAGVDFNRIAGPNGTYGYYNGVVIARINTDIALADFEAGVRNLVNDTENAYWTLYYAYRNLDANVAGRDSSLQTWRKVHAMAAAGAADAAQEAQAREQYFLFRGNVEQALSDLYTTENRLRYMMGLSATDGRLIRPADEPTTAKVVFDWQESHQEALARGVELRRQRWTIKRREMELVAAKNFLLPRLDLDGIYRWRGFGNELISSSGKDNFDNAYQTLLGGSFQEWQLGFNFTMPIGFRQGLAAVRNAELQLARERAILQEQELEISHLLADAIRALDRSYMLSQTNFNRRAAAKRQVEAVQQNYEVGRITLDQLLDAQRRLADAEGQYFNSLAAYNRAIAGVHYRKGSLLEYNAVYLAEGPWASKAYFDAEERARRRDAGMFINYGFTRPGVFSEGPIGQNLHGGEWSEGEIIEGEVLSDEVLREEEGSQMPAIPNPDAVLDEPTGKLPAWPTPGTNAGGAAPTPTPSPAPEPAGKPMRFEQADGGRDRPSRIDAVDRQAGPSRSDGVQQAGDSARLGMLVPAEAGADESRQSRTVARAGGAPPVGSRLQRGVVGP